MALSREGRTPRDLDPPSYALCDYAFEIAVGRRIPPRVAEALHQHFRPRQIVDIALLTGYYIAVAALSIGLDIALEPPETLALEQAWQAKLAPQPNLAAAVDGEDSAGGVA